MNIDLIAKLITEDIDILNEIEKRERKKPLKDLPEGPRLRKEPKSRIEPEKYEIDEPKPIEKKGPGYTSIIPYHERSPQFDKRVLKRPPSKLSKEFLEGMPDDLREAWMARIKKLEREALKRIKIGALSEPASFSLGRPMMALFSQDPSALEEWRELNRNINATIDDELEGQPQDQIEDVKTVISYTVKKTANQLAKDIKPTKHGGHIFWEFMDNIVVTILMMILPKLSKEWRDDD